MATQKEVRDRIASVKNIQKITRAMEMVAAARLRRAEQRIAALRPYARALMRMTRRAVEAAEHIPSLPILEERENVKRVGVLLVTGDRGLAGGFNSQIVRRGLARDRELRAEGLETVWYASGRKGVSSLEFRGFHVEGAYTGFTDRPAYADARRIADDLAAAYVDGRLDRVEAVHNHYISPLSQQVRHEIVLPIQEMASLTGESEEWASPGEAAGGGEGAGDEAGSHALWLYEPEPPEEILKRLVSDYIEITLFRRLLESTASEHGARMTAMRSAAQNAGEMIDDLTLEANRRRQAEITQEIMEVVAGAEALS